MAEHTQGDIRSDQDALATGHDLPGLWLKKIERQKEDEKAWHKDASQAVTIYEAGDDKETAAPSFNILHSNIEITVPSLYNSTPIPDVRRRYGDADPIGKQAVDVIERALSYQIDQYDFDATVIEATRDAELAGRGIARVRYEPQMDGENVGYQKVTCEHVVWDKWGHGPARHWAEVPWVWFEHDLTYDDLKRLGVGENRIKELAFNDTEDKGGDAIERQKDQSGVFKTVKAFEIWDKATRKVYFVAEQDKKTFLKESEDPLRLEQFFPIPKAMQPLRKRRSLTPIVPYKIYETQVLELDKVTKRINGLVGQLKVRGLYDKRLGAELERLKYCEDGQYEPVEDVGAFSTSGGGLEKALAHWPLAEIIAALEKLYVQREQIKQVIYEITGLSDVLRGSTDPNETLGAQQLKAQQGSTRLSQRQRMVADFCRDLLRMKAELICNHFTPENLQAMVGMQLDPQVFPLLQNDLMRSYRVDIESDSTIRADVMRSQEQMNLFLAGTAQYVQAMAPMLEVAPTSKPAIVEIYSSFARHFKLGKSAEDALDALVEGAKQPEQPKPDPEEAKMALEQQKMQMQSQMDQQKSDREMQKMQLELQIKREMAQIDMQIKQMDLAVKERMAEIDMHKAQMDIEAQSQKTQLDQAAKVYDIETKREMSEMDIKSKAKMADIDMKKAKGLPIDAEGGDDDPMERIVGAMMEALQVLRQEIAQGNERVLKAVSSPKALTVQRGRDGRVSGAVIQAQQQAAE